MNKLWLFLVQEALTNIIKYVTHLTINTSSYFWQNKKNHYLNTHWGVHLCICVFQKTWCGQPLWMTFQLRVLWQRVQDPKTRLCSRSITACLLNRWRLKQCELNNKRCYIWTTDADFQTCSCFCGSDERRDQQCWALWAECGIHVLQITPAQHAR